MLLEITLKWGEKEVRVKPTMELLCRIESDNISFPVLASKLSNSDIPMAQCSTVIAHFLNEGGIFVSKQEVYEEICNTGIDTMVELMGNIFMAIFPQSKNAKAPKKKLKRKK